MASVTVIMDYPRVDWFRGWSGPIGQSFRRLEKETVWRQRQRAGVKTGALRTSVTSRRHRAGANGNLSFDAGSWTVHYAIIHELGSKPHIILPKNPTGKLVFFWPKVGRVVSFKAVQHPGTPAYRFLNEGLESAMRAWERGG